MVLVSVLSAALEQCNGDVLLGGGGETQDAGQGGNQRDDSGAPIDATSEDAPSTSDANGASPAIDAAADTASSQDSGLDASLDGSADASGDAPPDAACDGAGCPDAGPTTCGPVSWFICGSVCVDTNTDSNNCGGCGVSCASVASAPAKCTAGRCMFILASGQFLGNGGGAVGVAADDTSVYWTNPTSTGGSVRKAPLDGLADGGSATVLASTQDVPGGNIVVDSTSVYWAAGNKILKAPKDGVADGGAPTVLASKQVEQPSGLAVDANNVYWVTTGTPPNNYLDGTVAMAPLGGVPDGGAPTVLAAGQAYPTGIAVEGTDVYWLNGGSTQVGVAGSVMSLRLVPPGGAPAVLATGTLYDGLSGVAVDGTSAYWSDSTTGSVMKAPLAGFPDGGAPTVLATGQTDPGDIVVDGGYVYWANSTNDASIVKAPVGGGPITTLVTGQNGVTGLTVHGANIYWAYPPDGTIRMTAK
jgi:hypothetical protein